jgi:hypothetical protein
MSQSSFSQEPGTNSEKALAHQHGLRLETREQLLSEPPTIADLESEVVFETTRTTTRHSATSSTTVANQTQTDINLEKGLKADALYVSTAHLGVKSRI